MDEVTRAAIYSALRSILIATGAYCTGRGWIDNDSANQVVGSLMVALPAVWGIISRMRAEKEKKTAAAVPPETKEPQ